MPGERLVCLMNTPARDSEKLNYAIYGSPKLTSSSSPVNQPGAVHVFHTLKRHKEVISRAQSLPEGSFFCPILGDQSLKKPKYWKEGHDLILAWHESP